MVQRGEYTPSDLTEIKKGNPRISRRRILGLFGVAAVAPVIAACTSDAQPVEPNRPGTVAPTPDIPTPTETNTAPTQAEVNQEVLNDHKAFRDLVVTDPEGHLRTILDQQGSAPQTITEGRDYLDHVRGGTERTDPRFYTQLGHNVMVYMNIVQANREEFPLDHTMGETLRQAAAMDIIQNIGFVYNEPGSDKNVDVSKDEFVQTVEEYINYLPEDTVITGVTMPMARNDLNDSEGINNGTWFSIEMTNSDGTIVKDSARFSGSVPDAAMKLNNPHIWFESSDAYNGAPFEVGFMYKEGSAIDPYSAYVDQQQTNA